MDKGRYINQKLAKRTGFAEMQAAGRTPDPGTKRGRSGGARRAVKERAIIGGSFRRGKS